MHWEAFQLRGSRRCFPATRPTLPPFNCSHPIPCPPRLCAARCRAMPRDGAARHGTASLYSFPPTRPALPRPPHPTQPFPPHPNPLLSGPPLSEGAENRQRQAAREVTLRSELDTAKQVWLSMNSLHTYECRRTLHTNVSSYVEYVCEK